MRTVPPHVQTAAAAAANVTHGATGTRLFRIWTSMLTRCTNKNAPNFKNYGGRGINVCDRWQDFTHFMADVGEPGPDQQLDRINNDGNYEPGNVRWTSAFQNSRNRRNNRKLTLGDRTMCITDWAAELGLTHQAIHRRINHLGWTVERALTQEKR